MGVGEALGADELRAVVGHRNAEIQQSADVVKGARNVAAAEDDQLFVGL